MIRIISSFAAVFSVSRPAPSGRPADPIDDTAMQGVTGNRNQHADEQNPRNDGAAAADLADHGSATMRLEGRADSRSAAMLATRILLVVRSQSDGFAR